MKKLFKIILRHYQRCPNCGSTNLTQTADHSSKGYNGYVCNDCKTTFGN